MTFKDFPFPSSPPQTVLAVCYYKTIFLLFKIVTKFISEDCLLPAPAQSSARCCSQPCCQAYPEPRTPNPPCSPALSAAEVQACSKHSNGE